MSLLAPAPPMIPPPPPLPAGRLIPQVETEIDLNRLGPIIPMYLLKALPGAPCEPGVECTGGSVCSMGICLCPPELVQEGTVCVSRTVCRKLCIHVLDFPCLQLDHQIYGVVPPAPPPIPVAPAAVGWVDCARMVSVSLCSTSPF